MNTLRPNTLEYRDFSPTRRPRSGLISHRLNTLRDKGGGGGTHQQAKGPPKGDPPTTQIKPLVGQDVHRNLRVWLMLPAVEVTVTTWVPIGAVAGEELEHPVIPSVTPATRTTSKPSKRTDPRRRNPRNTSAPNRQQRAYTGLLLAPPNGLSAGRTPLTVAARFSPNELCTAAPPATVCDAGVIEHVR